MRDGAASAYQATTTTEPTGCDFCLRLNGELPERPWFDFAEIGSSDSFVSVVALGALTPGHILIVSRRHVERGADLNIDELGELKGIVKRWSVELLKHWDAAPFIFEHGGRSASTSGGCIAHAHIQMLPLAVSPLSRTSNAVRISSIENLQSYREVDYIMVWRRDVIFIKSPGRRQSGQYMRRRIAELLGCPDAWDYLVFPNFDIMKSTLDSLNNSFELPVLAEVM
jgi:diadenosine tetraphosphate (Ap4A) HIT family hydrolase